MFWWKWDNLRRETKMTKTTVTAKEVFDELNTEMARLVEEEGLVHMSAPFIVNESGTGHSTPLDVAIVLNNVLRLRREGKFETCVIS
jgi:hypothetical protein